MWDLIKNDKKRIKSDFVLFGKYHNNSVICWLELELTKDVYAKKPIPTGAEMFEADSQNFIINI